MKRIGTIPVYKELYILKIELEMNDNHRIKELKSFPVAVCSKPNQESAVWPYVLWSALEEYKSRKDKMKRIFWEDFEKCLDFLFIKTGRTLSDENKKYLRKMKISIYNLCSNLTV